jgi:hypothetical protein
MAIVNRDLAASQQRETWQETVNTTTSGVSAGIANPWVATAQTYPLFNVPRPCQLVAAAESAWGLSGTPVHSLWVYRWLGASGFTSFPIGQTLTISAFGTSGMLYGPGGASGQFGGFSLFAAVTYPLQTGDQLVLYTQGANTAVNTATVTCVVQNLQDIKQDFGV